MLLVIFTKPKRVITHLSERGPYTSMDVQALLLSVNNGYL